MNRIGYRGRSPLFRKMARNISLAKLLAKKPGEKNLILELSEAERAGRWSRSSRRDFIKMLTLAGVSLATAKVTKLFARVKPLGGSKVAIIGGGFAGLTAAHRLVKAGIPVDLFEARSGGFGGRVQTLKNFNSEGMFVELGAELVDTNHETLIALCHEFGIEVESIIEDDKDVLSSLYFIDQKYYSDKEVIENFAALGKSIAHDQAIAFPESAGSPTALAREFDNKSIKDYLDSQKDISPWLKKLLLVSYTNEYGLDASLQSALNFLNYIDPDTSHGFRIFGDSDESMRIKGGNGRLTEALVAALKEKGDLIRFNPGHPLKAIASKEEGLRLTFESSGVRSREVVYKRVISAIPLTLLREVDGLDSLGMSSEKLAAIREFGYGTNMKSMIGFQDRFWRKDYRNVKASNAAIATDLRTQQYWETSRAQKGKSGILTNFSGAGWGAECAIMVGSEAGRSQAHDIIVSDLSKVWPDVKVQEKLDRNKRSIPWPTFRWSKGAYSCPKVGQVTTHMEILPDTY